LSSCTLTTCSLPLMLSLRTLLPRLVAPREAALVPDILGLASAKELQRTSIQGAEEDAVGNPHANKLTIHILAAVAQHEREIISARTSAALKAAKARGKRLGNPKLLDARRHATAARKESADRFSTNVLPVIREIQRSGIKSLRGIARTLAARGIPTARGGAWTAVQVSDILGRAG
jgi:Resolvase, N terminal domain/Recombinase